MGNDRSDPPPDRGLRGRQPPEDLKTLFHHLNNQLGIILANAELLEAKSQDETNRSRAAQIVSSTLEALTAAKAIRARHEGS